MLTHSPTIGIVNAHYVFRKGLCTFFSTSTPFQHLFEAGDNEELEARLTGYPPPDILLLELAMPVSKVYQTLSWLAEAHPLLPVIVFTGHQTDITEEKLYDLGARAVLQKDDSEQEWTKTLIRVYEEGYYYSNPAHRKYIQRALSGAGGKRIKPSISDREELFLCFVGTDLTYQQIAFKMKLSERAIDKVRRILFEKLSVKSRQGLAVKAASNGFCLHSVNKLGGGAKRA